MRPQTRVHHIEVDESPQTSVELQTKAPSYRARDDSDQGMTTPPIADPAWALFKGR